MEKIHIIKYVGNDGELISQELNNKKQLEFKKGKRFTKRYLPFGLFGLPVFITGFVGLYFGFTKTFAWIFYGGFMIFIGGILLANSIYGFRKLFLKPHKVYIRKILGKKLISEKNLIKEEHYVSYHTSCKIFIEGINDTSKIRTINASKEGYFNYKPQEMCYVVVAGDNSIGCYPVNKYSLPENCIVQEKERLYEKSLQNSINESNITTNGDCAGIIVDFYYDNNIHGYGKQQKGILVLAIVDDKTILFKQLLAMDTPFNVGDFVKCKYQGQKITVSSMNNDSFSADEEKLLSEIEILKENGYDFCISLGPEDDHKSKTRHRKMIAKTER